MMKIHSDVIIIGAGASGLMCAIEAAKRQRKVMVLEHANKAGKKILMSGGGHCNFTNYSIDAENYISNNPHFCKSALSRYKQWDFLAFIEKHHIAYHERAHGQLFCDHSAKDIWHMLLTECQQYHVEIRLNCRINSISQTDHANFHLHSNQGDLSCASLVIASGGLSIPKMGATPFGYKVAEQFAIKVQATSAGLVPFTLQPEQKSRFSELSGIAVPCTVSNHRQSFSENILFTHRGLSGPVILQISSYWKPGEEIEINLLPYLNLPAALKKAQQHTPKRSVKTFLSEQLPKRLVNSLITKPLLESPLAGLTQEKIILLSQLLQQWRIKPNATEGYRTAEVTLGGVDCNEISSKTMQARSVPGLYFIGEVLDVTGWLGGYNFQWAWSSGWCAGQYV